MYTVPLMAVFTLITIVIVTKGVAGGIEKAAKVLMPALFILIFVVAIRSLTLDGAMAGVDFYLNPDFSKINADSVLAALGQAFFSMSIGWGIMVTYGSYLPKDSNLGEFRCMGWINGCWCSATSWFYDFPAVFAFGKSPEAGPTLVFQVLPEVFSSMPGGAIIGALFFLLLTVAALTSSVSMLEVPASYFVDEKNGREKICTGSRCLDLHIWYSFTLSSVDGNFFANISVPTFDGEVTGFFDIIDYYFRNLLYRSCSI